MVRDDVARLDAHLGYWLRAVSNQVSHAFSARMTAMGVTVAEWVVLRSLYGGRPVAPSHLAAELGMTRGAITKLADRLIAKSLIVRRPSQEDARSQTLALTSAGEKLVPALARLADQNDAEFFGRLSATERRTLEKLLRKMAHAFGVAIAPVD